METAEDGGFLWSRPAPTATATASAGPARRASREAEDEALRLLYVALTRARDRLIVMRPSAPNAKEGFETGSWWDALGQTSSRLVDAGRDARAAEMRRFGAVRPT